MSNTITKSVKIDVTYEQPTISAAWVSRLLGDLSKLDFKDVVSHEFQAEHGFYLPWDFMYGIREGKNTIQPNPARNRDVIGYRDWGYLVEKNQQTLVGDKHTSVTVWFYRHDELASPQPEIEFIKHYLQHKHNLEVSEITYDYDYEEQYDGKRRRVTKPLPGWAYVEVSKKPIVPEHFDGCPCGLHEEV